MAFGELTIEVLPTEHDLSTWDTFMAWLHKATWRYDR